MFDNRKGCWGEKWVLKVGRKVFAVDKYCKFVELFLLVCTAILAFMLFLLLMKIPAFDEGVMLIAICAAGAVGSVLLATKNFERRHFYRTIQEQKEKIEHLEKELQAKH
jgi:hypothetical protein